MKISLHSSFLQKLLKPPSYYSHVSKCSLTLLPRWKEHSTSAYPKFCTVFPQNQALSFFTSVHSITIHARSTGSRLQNHPLLFFSSKLHFRRVSPHFNCTVEDQSKRHQRTGRSIKFSQQKTRDIKLGLKSNGQFFSKINAKYFK